jgi:hypothetical protein
MPMSSSRELSPLIAIAYGVVSRPTPHKILMALNAACQLLLVARSCKHRTATVEGD